jgi:ribosome-associated toxin RatA of RatAB toxin-antitoxin module
MKRIEISASVDQVWQVIADFGSVEKWAPTVVQSRCSTEVERGVGAKRTLTTTTGQVTEELVTEWDEGHCFTFEISNGLASVVKILRETWTVEHTPKGTVVVVVMDCNMKDGSINSLLGSLVVERVLKKMLVQNLAGLKHHIETGELVTSKTAKLPLAAVS